MTNKEKEINQLKGLYKQNLDFLDSVVNGTTKKKYKNSTIAEFKNLNRHLKEYIAELELGLDCHRDITIWCELFGDILAEELDDDNFPKGGW